MFNYLTHNKKIFTLFIVVMLLYGTTTAVVALVLAAILEAATGESLRLLIQVTLFAVFFVAFYTALQYVYEKLKNIILVNAMVQLKSDVFLSIMAKTIPDFETRNSASYINELTTNVNMVTELYFANYFRLLHMSVSFSSAVAITLYFQPLLLAVMAVLGLLSFAVTKVTGKGIESATQSVSDASQSYQVGIKEYFAGFRIIKAFSIINHINVLHGVKNQDMENKKMIYALKTTLVGCVGQLVGFLSTIAIMAVAAGLSIRGLVSIGTVFAVGHLMGQVTSPIHALPRIILNFKSVKPILTNLSNIMKIKSHDDVCLKLEEVIPNIEIKNMSFSYNETPVFSSVDITIKPGKKYVILGASGSGKTTLFSLLLGYYNDYLGSIKYDEMEVRDINKADIHKKVGAVFQETFLFDDTLRNNLTLYDKRFTEDEIMDAIRNSGLIEFVNNYPGKLDGKITENGKNISGGERQRISLARVLLRKQKVLLLDEFTGSLDAEKAFEIEQYLLKLKGTTLLVITHRLNKTLLTQYDYVVVLKDEQIVEIGDYDELIKINGHLASLLDRYGENLYN